MTLTISPVPILSPSTGKPIAFFVRPRVGDWKDFMRHGFPETESPSSLARTAEEILHQLSDEISGGTRASRFIVPISARALVGEDNATRVVDSLREIQESVRQRIIVEMHDLPRSLSLDALEIATIPLLLFVGGFIARMPDGLKDATVFSNCNYLGLSVSQPDEIDDLTVVQTAWSKTAPKRLKLFVWNLPQNLMSDAERLDVAGVIPRKS